MTVEIVSMLIYRWGPVLQVKFILALFLILALSTPVLQVAAQEDREFTPEPILKFYPIYPRKELLDGREGEVSLLMRVNAQGVVDRVLLEEASNEVFAEAAREAVQDWKFETLVRGAESYRVRQVIRFRTDQNSFFSLQTLSTHPDLRRRVVPLVGIRPEYPEELRKRQLRGFADIIITVDAAGKVVRAKIEHVSHPSFRDYALSAARQWRFRPVNPVELHFKNTQKRSAYLSPDISYAQCRLTLLFSPELPDREPLDLRLASLP